MDSTAVADSLPASVAVATGLTASLGMLYGSGRRAFPGWTEGLRAGCLRGLILVALTTYSTLVVATLLALSMTPRAVDPQLLLGLLVAATVGTVTFELMTLTTSTPRTDQEPAEADPEIPRVTAICVACEIGPSAAGAMLDAGPHPTHLVITWLSMILLYVAWETYQSKASAHCARWIRSLSCRALQNPLRQFGGLIVAKNAIELHRTDGPERIARTLEVLRNAGSIQLVSPPAAKAIATAMRQQLASDPNAHILEVTCTSSWLDSGTTLTIGAPDGQAKSFPEERQPPLRGQRRGFPAGFIPIPTEELERLGLQITSLTPT